MKSRDTEARTGIDPDDELDREPVEPLDVPDPGTGPLRPAQPPRGPSMASLVAVALATITLGGSLVLMRDFVVLVGLFDSTPVVTALVGKIGTIGPGPWLLGLGALTFTLGLWMLATLVRRRPDRTYQVRAVTGVYLRMHDAALVAEQTARTVAGVLSVHARPSRKRIVVEIQTTGGDHIEAQVCDLVEARLAGLAPPPTVRVLASTSGAHRHLSEGRRR